MSGVGKKRQADHAPSHLPVLFQSWSGCGGMGISGVWDNQVAVAYNSAGVG